MSTPSAFTLINLNRFVTDPDTINRSRINLFDVQTMIDIIDTLDTPSSSCLPDNTLFFMPDHPRATAIHNLDRVRAQLDTIYNFDAHLHDDDRAMMMTFAMRNAPSVNCFVNNPLYTLPYVDDVLDHLRRALDLIAFPNLAL